MKAQIAVEVENAVQAEQIAQALQRPDVLSFVVAMGALNTISHDRARARILTFLTDYAADPGNTRVDRFAPIGKRE